VSGAKQKNSTSSFLPWMSKKATKGLIALTLEIRLRSDGDGLTISFLSQFSRIWLSLRDTAWVICMYCFVILGKWITIFIHQYYLPLYPNWPTLCVHYLFHCPTKYELNKSPAASLLFAYQLRAYAQWRRAPFCAHARAHHYSHSCARRTYWTIAISCLWSFTLNSTLLLIKRDLFV
jgi:hypothetical protein